MVEIQKTIDITVDVCKVVNFAMQQNYVPIVRKIVIHNQSEAETGRMKVSVKTDPDIAEEWSIEIEPLRGNDEHILDNINLQLSALKLYELTERVNGALIVTVVSDMEELACNRYNVAFLSHDEWSGANSYPEFLAAFVTPNHPYITEILKNAEVLLNKWTGSPSFTGYQSKNSNNVLKQMAAIYGALQLEQITYCAPPASFEEDGQKVRLCNTIREQKLGTCLDLSLLYGGCLEAVGLNPIIVFFKGHAFVACWLEDESFAECIQDDISVLTKRIAPTVNEICAVETTALVKGNGKSFDDAVLQAESHLRNPDDFLYLVGIRRSRGSGIRPIPLKREDGSFDYGKGAKIRTSVTGAPGEVKTFGKLEHKDSVEVTRLHIWERNLLDVSMRNMLLNFRVTKNSIQLLTDSLHDLEDALVRASNAFMYMNIMEAVLGIIKPNQTGTVGTALICISFVFADTVFIFRVTVSVISHLCIAVSTEY